MLMCAFSYRLMSRLAVVCGGSRGIGKAVSRLLAERGCRLAVVSRNEDAARATVSSLRGGTLLHLTDTWSFCLLTFFCFFKKMQTP